jgi:hypothetical protein
MFAFLKNLYNRLVDRLAWAHTKITRYAVRLAIRANGLDFDRRTGKGGVPFIVTFAQRAAGFLLYVLGFVVCVLVPTFLMTYVVTTLVSLLLGQVIGGVIGFLIGSAFGIDLVFVTQRVERTLRELNAQFGYAA